MNSSSSLTRVFTPGFTVQAGARALALVSFLFLLNAFIQSGSIAALEVVVGLGWLALCYGLSARCPVPTVLALTFLGGVAWGLFIESHPVSDWHYLFISAQDLSQGRFYAPFESNSFTTVVYGSVFHLLFGSGWVTNYIASALTWTLGSGLVYLAIAPFTGDKRLARFICFALALCPTFLVFSPVLGSKGMFFLVSAGCAWLVSKHLRSAQWNAWLYLGLGLATALLYLTRPHGALLLAVVVAIILATGPSLRPAPGRLAAILPRAVKTSRKNIIAAAILGAGFTAVVLAHGALSYVNGYGFSVGAHRTGAFVLLFGTSVAAGGMWNEADVEWLEGGAPSLAEKRRKAREAALARLADVGVPRFLKFALTTKLEGLYGRDPKLFRRAHGKSQRADMLKAYVQPAAERVEQGAYRLVFLLFLALLVREVWRPSWRLVLGVIVLLYSLPHLLFEVDQRYHMLMLPYFVVGSALLAGELASVANTVNRKPGWRLERFTPREF